MNSKNFNLSELKFVPIKETSEINIYFAKYRNEKFVFKECLTRESLNRMNRTVELFENVAKSDTDFIIAKPKKFFETLYDNIFVEKYVDGICLEQFDVSVVNRAIICRNIVRYLQSLSNVDLHMNGKKFSWKIFFTDYVEEKISIVRESAIYSSNNLKNFLSYLEANVDMLNDTSGVKLIHNDLNAGNILIQSNFEIQFIDYERWIVGDPLKDLSKMLWYFRQNSDFGKIFKSVYNDILGVIDDKLLKFYFATDILNHLSQYETLVQNPVWQIYFHQEFEIVQNIWREDFCLWQQT